MNRVRKFGKMLSKDQVQMVASNQQAAGVFSTAAVAVAGRVKCSLLYKNINETALEITVVLMSVSQSKTHHI